MQRRIGFTRRREGAKTRGWIAYGAVYIIADLKLADERIPETEGEALAAEGPPDCCLSHAGRLHGGHCPKADAEHLCHATPAHTEGGNGPGSDSGRARQRRSARAMVVPRSAERDLCEQHQTGTANRRADSAPVQGDASCLRSGCYTRTNFGNPRPERHGFGCRPQQYRSRHCCRFGRGAAHATRSRRLRRHLAYPRFAADHRSRPTSLAGIIGTVASALVDDGRSGWEHSVVDGRRHG